MREKLGGFVGAFLFPILLEAGGLFATESAPRAIVDIRYRGEPCAKWRTDRRAA
jgi:hypothetical protein